MNKEREVSIFEGIVFYSAVEHSREKARLIYTTYNSTQDYDGDILSFDSISSLIKAVKEAIDKKDYGRVELEVQADSFPKSMRQEVRSEIKRFEEHLRKKGKQISIFSFPGC